MLHPFTFSNIISQSLILQLGEGDLERKNREKGKKEKKKREEERKKRTQGKKRRWKN